MKNFIKNILICTCAFAVNATYATQITIVNLDGAGEGFNDNTPVLPVGGNTGETIGSQRLKVFQYAAKIWESIIDDDVEIKVDANFDPLTCSSSSAVLGSAGTVNLNRDFTNAPISRTWYPIALANSLAGSDLSSLSDIKATFNVDLDNNNNCLNNTNWYYGLDGNKPWNGLELLQVVMHEIGHGLGFQTFVNLQTGSKFGTPGRNDAYMLNLEDHSLGKTWASLSNSERLASITDSADLHWIGSNVTANIGQYTAGINQGHVRQYAPSSVSSGSSVSHFDSAMSPNELMEPFITSTPEGPGLAIDLMKDIGWQIFSSFVPVLGEISDQTMSGSSSQVEFALKDLDSSSLSFSFDSSNPSLINSSGLSVTGTGRLRVLNITPNTGVVGSALITLNVSDGVNAVSESFQLTTTNSVPIITVISPADGANYILGDTVSFQVAATDTEDGELSENTQWASSIDGELGIGTLINTQLTLGAHSITASITDSGGLTSSTNFLVNVYGDADADGMNDLWELDNFSTLNRDGTGDFDLDGINDLDEYLILIAVPDGDLNRDGVVNVIDILIAQQILNGLKIITPVQLVHGDISPLVNDVSVPDGQFDIGDVMLITKKATN